MFFGNVFLLSCLIASWVFNSIAIWNMIQTIRHQRYKDLSSAYAGFASGFSFLGIVTWFIATMVAVTFLNFWKTMTFGVPFLLITALLLLVCYLFSRYYVSRFNSAKFYSQILASDDIGSSDGPYGSQEILIGT